jgi:hypothetical protein
MSRLFEPDVEETTLAWLEALGYVVLHGPDIMAGEIGAERADPHCHNAVPKTLISSELRVKHSEKLVEASL